MAVAPWVARRSDRSRRRKPWVVAGCALSAAACLAFPLVGGVAGAAIACALLGVGQALLSGPVIALVTEAFDRDPHATQIVGATPEQALAAFRFIERFGSIAAPFAAAACVALFGLQGAIGAIGLLLGAGAVAVYIGLARYKETGQR
jgi:MFS family permease